MSLYSTISHKASQLHSMH